MQTPQVVEGVFATVALDDASGAAVLHWARGVIDYGPRLRLLDWIVEQLAPELWTHASARQDELALQYRARRGSAGLFVESPLLSQYAVARGHRARPILEHLTSNDAWRGLCAVATSYQREQAVAVTQLALDRAKQEKFGAFTFRGGPRPEDDATVAAFLYGVVIGLDEAAARPPMPAKVKVVA